MEVYHMSEITMTPKEYMDECVNRMLANKDMMTGVNAKLQFDFSKDDSGKFYIEIIDGIAQPSVEGEIDNPTTIFSGKYETFYHMTITGKVNGAVAAMTGKIKAKGDTSYGMKLGKWCSKK
jgi:putative sterol carrier protein